MQRCGDEDVVCCDLRGGLDRWVRVMEILVEGYEGEGGGDGLSQRMGQLKYSILNVLYESLCGMFFNIDLVKGHIPGEQMLRTRKDKESGKQCMLRELCQ